MKAFLRIAIPSLAAVSLIAVMPVRGQVGQTRPRLDPDETYKRNCMRCHVALPTYRPGAQQTIVTHMRVRANLTGEQAAAILDYLIGGEPAAPVKPQAAEEPRSVPEPTPVQKPSAKSSPSTKGRAAPKPTIAAEPHPSPTPVPTAPPPPRAAAAPAAVELPQGSRRAAAEGGLL